LDGNGILLGRIIGSTKPGGGEITSGFCVEVGFGEVILEVPFDFDLSGNKLDENDDF
jgi:hypothetical protein